MRYLLIFSVIATFGATALAEPFPRDPGRIELTNARDGGTISSSFTLIGRANSAWFGESVFSVVVYGSQNRKWETFARAAGSSWMRPRTMVWFSAQLDLNNYAGPATIDLIRSNESDDRSFDKTVRFKVTVAD
jgi:hypothetical protein